MTDFSPQQCVVLRLSWHKTHGAQCARFMGARSIISGQKPDANSWGRCSDPFLLVWQATSGAGTSWASGLAGETAGGAGAHHASVRCNEVVLCALSRNGAPE